MEQGPLGARIKYYRDIKGLTIAQLAKIAGMACGTISYIETGKHQGPSWLTVKKLEIALGLCEGALTKGLYVPPSNKS